MRLVARAFADHPSVAGMLEPGYSFRGAECLPSRVAETRAFE